MTVENLASAAAARVELRNRGFRQVTYTSNSDPEFWWHKERSEAAEVVRNQILTYSRRTAAYQQIAALVRKGPEAGVKPAPEQMAPNLAQAIVYINRAGLQEHTISDIRKAQTFLVRELRKRLNLGIKGYTSTLEKEEEELDELPADE